MKSQSERKVVIKGVTIGGSKPLICIPLIEKEKSKVLEHAKFLKSMNPDLIEWRADGYDDVGDVKDCLSVLDEMNRGIGNTPLLFTCRIDSEGGVAKLTEEDRLTLIKTVMQSGNVDLVDIEMCNPPVFIDAVKSVADHTGVKLILSYHNFTETPETNIIQDKLVQAQKRGCDIAKVAVMPSGPEDVLILLEATLRARRDKVKCPIIAISMGDLGRVTRIAGGLFGSDITFAAGQAETAPGQIPAKFLRDAMDLLYEI